MIREIILNDEITLWWYLKDFAQVKSFFGYINNELRVETTKTYIVFNNLTSDREYSVKICDKDGNVLFDKKIRTKKDKKKIDITASPYNAVGDGETLNTKAIQKALDDCDENSYVYIPSGEFLSGALKLKSNTELYIEEGGALKGTENVEDYLPKIKSRFEGLELQCYSSLLNAGELDSKTGANCHNIIIRGGGKIVGGGKTLRDKIIEVESARLKDYIQALGDKIKEYEKPNTLPGRFRPRLINLSNVENVIVTNVGIEYSPSWNLHPVYCKNVSIYGCTFRSEDRMNGDGIDPDSTVNCAIFNCEFSTGDDCIAIKSGRNPEGNVVNRKSEDIYIFDCKANCGHGISIGSEMSGGIENVYIWDCDIEKSRWGLHIKGTKKRGGYIKNIFVNDCVIPHLFIHSVSYNDDGEAAPAEPIFSNIYLEDCVIVGEEIMISYNDDYLKYIEIKGFSKENPIRDVFLKNIALIENQSKRAQEMLVQNVKNLVLDNVYKVTR